jgi:hypothetical protein
MAIDKEKILTTRPRRSVVARLHRVALGLVICSALFLIAGVPLFWWFDIPGVLADLLDALGRPTASGDGMLLIAVLAAVLGTALGLLLLLATWRKAGASYAGTLRTILPGVWSIVVVVVYLFSMNLAMPRHTKRPVNCTSNLRQLSLGIMMYVQDNGDRLPEQWEKAIKPYFSYPQESAANSARAIYICPSTQRHFHKRGGYGMNANLPGKHYNDLQNPESLLLLADSVTPGMLLSSERDIALRHPTGQGYCCSYLDGSVKLREAGETIRWK